MGTERFDFVSSDGHTLSGRLEVPDGPIRGTALFAHCFTCGKDIPSAARIARSLARHGIAVLRFDFTGIGGSEGEFASTDFSHNVRDLVSAAAELRRVGRPADLLIGHSLGGAAVLAAAHAIPDARAFVTINAPSDPGHVVHLFGSKMEQLLSHGEAEFHLGGKTVKVRREFIDDVADQKLTDRIARLGCGLLVLHAPTDDIVGIENAGQIFAAARHPKSFVSLDGADHMLTRREDTRRIGHLISAWVTPYLASRDDGVGDTTMAADAAAHAPRAEESGVVRVTEAGAKTHQGLAGGLFRQTVQAGRHTFTVDEPTGIGGDDSGPTPYDLLLSGLGACTTMTLRMYAERKGWTVGPLSVTLRHGRTHAADCADCETKTGSVDVIERELHLPAGLDPDQRAKLLEIAEKCPVHRTLTHEVKVRTVLADS